MDASILTQKILSNPENIETILHKLGHEQVRDRGKYYQTSNLDGDNNTAISVLKDNMVYQNFSRNDSGNLFTLIMYDKKVSFPDALKFAAKCIGFKDDDIKVKLPFGGFYRKLLGTEKNNYEVDLDIYTEDNLPNPCNLSKLWLEDGVMIDTQLEYGIRYDIECDSIIIPVHDYNGNIVGAKKRLNKKHCDLNERWGMYIPYPKTLLCYGWVHNYKKIMEQKKVFIFEAEKSVAQLSSMGCDLGLAVGGHKISDTQRHYILSLMTDEIIIAFDEGLCEDEIKYEASKLSLKVGDYKNKVGYIFDSCGNVLKSGSKDSPADHGKKDFIKLYKECVKWV